MLTVIFIIYLVKLVRAEKDFFDLIEKEHRKSVEGLQRYKTMKNGV